MPEERKYCQDGCGTILWDLTYQPHRKFCDACNKKRAKSTSRTHYTKNREKYLQQRTEKRLVRLLRSNCFFFSKCLI